MTDRARDVDPDRGVPVSRRRLLAAGAAAVAASWTRVGRSYGANEAIGVGCIGCGGRMRGSLMPSLAEAGGARFVAVCDVWDRHREEGRKAAGGDVFVTGDHRAVLDHAAVDAVLVATPDHWHVPITVDACRAGKDVYVEKPLTHDLSEGEAVIAAQNEHRRIVQVGMQQRSMPQFIEGLEIVRSGKLGTVHKVHLTWNRNAPIGQRANYGIDPAGVDWKRFLGGAPEQPFDEYRLRNWRWFWDFGGGILTDLMVHYLDVANWLCGLDHPATASAIGDHFRAAGVWETPDTIQTLLHYPDARVEVYFEGTFVNARNRAMLEFMGTDATLYLDRGRLEIHPERGDAAPTEKLFGEGTRGGDFSKLNGALLHLRNWVECVKSREKPNAPAEEGVRAVLGAHMGNRAYREGRLVRWGE